MATPPVDLKRVRTVLEQYKELKLRDPKLGSVRAAKLFGLRPSTLREWCRRYGDEALANDQPELVIPTAPPEGETLEELLARKKTLMQRAKIADEWSKLVPISVTSDKPIAILLVGDPHTDDDHCDIERLESDLTVVRNTDGMYAGHLGDLTNNWVGRLKALYAAQSTTFNDGLRLTEWMLGLCPNLFVVNGNHDCWEKGADILKFIVKSGVHKSHGVRLGLTWADGQSIRLHARHDFPGHSQYSDTHGMKRELLWGHRDHILVAGHKHLDEARVEPSQEGVHWMFRVSGYKVIDEYAKERHFPDKRMSPSVTVVVNPYTSCEADKVKPFWDPQAGADYLKFLRAKK